jgi:hypothetical protein
VKEAELKYILPKVLVFCILLLVIPQAKATRKSEITCFVLAALKLCSILSDLLKK